MGEVYRYDVDGALTQISNMDQLAEAIGDHGRKLKLLNESLNDSWEGVDRKAFDEKMNNVGDEMFKAKERFKEFDQTLRHYIEEHRDTYMASIERAGNL